MITNHVALVLGAGASIPYGFPSGRDLKTEIVNRLSPRHAPDMLAKVLEAGCRIEDVEAFRTALYKSGKSSVDALLEHRKEFLHVGKIAIACALLPKEQEERLFAGQPNWYEHLFNRLNATFADFVDNSISVLTFNYDRSLEHYLFTALKNGYGKPAEECATTLQSLPIVHLYGQLGTLPFLGNGSNQTQMEFGAPASPDNLNRAAGQIRIVHEGDVAGGQFQHAYKLLEAADRICFVGFGYDQTNLRRLMAYNRTKSQAIWGSAKGFTEGECRIILKGFQNLGFQDVRVLDCNRGETLEFLRVHCPFD